MYENVFYCNAGKFVSQWEWIHPDRTINSYEIIFVIKGTVYIEEDGRRYRVKENELLLLEPNRRHFGYKKSTNTSFFWVHFTDLPVLDINLKHQNVSEAYHLSLLFKQLMHFHNEKESHESLDYLTRLILIECFSSAKKEKPNPKVSEISAWIKANRDTVLKVEQVCSHFGYNADYISRLFKASQGKSLKEYIDDVKLDYIKHLLIISNMSIADIAYNTGFEDYKYFLKFFKYHEGITPTQFLKTYPNTHINKK